MNCEVRKTHSRMRTPRQREVSEAVAVKRRRRQKHVGTTLRKNGGVARGVDSTDRAQRQNTQDFHKASRWG